MTTLIGHFRNEEYLLPWWLRHHVPMFDHGVLIDYSSTDASFTGQKRTQMFSGAVFIDCGTHDGQSLDEAIKPEYGFARIYGFEPMPNQYAHLLEKYDDDRMTFFNHGLLDHTGTENIYGSNDICEASLYPTKRDVNPGVVTPCAMVEASEWFRQYIRAEDQTILKLNCEGAEIPVLNNLIDSGEIWKIDHIMLDFDCRYIAGNQHLEQEMLDRLASIGFNRYTLADDDPSRTHLQKMAHWLPVVASHQPDPEGRNVGP
jgi:FkbM family methyltransferase